MNRSLIALALLLAACGKAPPSRVDTEGQAARAEVDQLTKRYAGCITGHADAIPLGDDPAGSIVDDIVRTCKAPRDALLVKVAAFDRLGHPRHSQAQAELVAEASVATIEDELRQNAVVAIIKRQQATPQSEGTKI